MHAFQRLGAVFLTAAAFLLPPGAGGAESGIAGARVTAVIPNSPAHQAGLDIDDVIVAVDTEPVRSADDYDKLLGGKRRVQLLIQRGREFNLIPCRVIHGRIGIGFAIVQR